MTIIGFGKSKHIGPYGMVYNDKGEIAAVSLGTGVPNHYLPPEYKPNTPCDYRKLDIWALGITILETLLSFNDAKIQAVLAAIRQSDQKQSSDIIDREIGGQQISPEFWKIMLKGMLNPDPTKRFSADEATNILLSLERSDAAKSKERDGKEKRDKVSEVRDVKEEEKKGEEKKGEEEGKRKIEGEKRRVEEKKRRAEEENRKIREKNRRMREENRKIREKNKKMKEEIRKIEGEGRGDEIDPYRGHSRETGGSTLRFPGDVLRLGYTHDYFIIKRAGEEIEDLYILDKGKSMGIPGK
jgi:serine/threonine protein kinase